MCHLSSLRADESVIKPKHFCHYNVRISSRCIFKSGHCEREPFVIKGNIKCSWRTSQRVCSNFIVNLFSCNSIFNFDSLGIKHVNFPKYSRHGTQIVRNKGARRKKPKKDETCADNMLK